MRENPLTNTSLNLTLGISPFACQFLPKPATITYLLDFLLRRYHRGSWDSRLLARNRRSSSGSSWGAIWRTYGWRSWAVWPPHPSSRRLGPSHARRPWRDSSTAIPNDVCCSLCRSICIFIQFYFCNLLFVFSLRPANINRGFPAPILYLEFFKIIIKFL